MRNAASLTSCSSSMHTRSSTRVMSSSTGSLSTNVQRTGRLPPYLRRRAKARSGASSDVAVSGSQLSRRSFMGRGARLQAMSHRRIVLFAGETFGYDWSVDTLEMTVIAVKTVHAAGEQTLAEAEGAEPKFLRAGATAWRAAS